jgi:hypothetical protein
MNTTTFAATIMNRTKTHLNSGTEIIESMDEATRFSLSCMTGVSGIIGTWAFASLVSAFFGNGGLLQLAQNYFSAVTGL